MSFRFVSRLKITDSLCLQSNFLYKQEIFIDKCAQRCILKMKGLLISIGCIERMLQNREYILSYF